MCSLPSAWTIWRGLQQLRRLDSLAVLLLASGISGS